MLKAITLLLCNEPRAGMPPHGSATEAVSRLTRMARCGKAKDCVRIGKPELGAAEADQSRREWRPQRCNERSDRATDRVEALVLIESSS